MKVAGVRVEVLATHLQAVMAAAAAAAALTVAGSAAEAFPRCREGVEPSDRRVGAAAR